MSEVAEVTIRVGILKVNVQVNRRLEKRGCRGYDPSGDTERIVTTTDAINV